ncbi:MAG: hypothetical protein WCO13_11035 [Bacteroidota bacterium]
MDSTYLSFVKKLLIFTVIISSLAISSYLILPQNFISPALPFLLPFFLAITLLSHYLQLKASQKSFSRFTSNFMMVTFLKLMVLMAVMLIYVLTHRWDAIPFICWYFVLYVCFTAFEVIELQRISDKKQ